MPRKRKSKISRQKNIQSALEARPLKRHGSHSMPRDSMGGIDCEDKGRKVVSLPVDGHAKVHLRN